MQDIKLENLELFYDCLDESNNFLYEVYKKPYFELLEMTSKNILAGEVLNDDLNPEQVKKLKAIYKKIAKASFTVEDIRKSVQSIVLRGFKEERIPNGNTTPDTLGIFFAYLITKICKNNDINIIDPLCGTGNLLFTVSNHLEKNCRLYACDNDDLMVKITSITADLLNTEVDIFFQDTLSLKLSGMDVVVCDMPHSECSTSYFPYEAILYYSGMLKDEGALIAICENDFFDYDKNQKFKQELFKNMSIIGLIELPDNMFKGCKPKIIIVMQKKLLDNKKCFMVKLPSIDNAKEFNNSLIDIEAWFENNNYNKKENI